MRPRRRHLAVLGAVLAAAVPATAHGSITTFAGTTGGMAGDGGPASLARLSAPQGVATAPDGGVLIADAGNHRIRRVAPDGIIGTIAGGVQGLGGDGGPAVAADLDSPAGVALLHDGSILIADTGNHRIRRISPAGTITTVAGTTRGLSGDGGPAVAARLDSPWAIAPTADGGYLVADAGNGRVRRIDASGVITTVAGTVPGMDGDGGPATAARLSDPRGLTVTADGGFLIADRGNGRVRRVGPDGVITTVAGAGLGFAGDGGTGASALLAGPASVLPLEHGGLLIADTGSERVRRVTPLGAVVTAAGSTRGLSGDGGPAAGGRFSDPGAMAWGPGGGLLVGDTGNDRVRLLTDLAPLPDPEPLRTVAVAPIRGAVSVRPRGRVAAIALQEPDVAPNLSAVDARAGAVRLRVRPLDATSDAVADISGGRFTLVQPAGEGHVADVRLQGPVRCAAPVRARGASAHATRRRAVTRRVRIKVRGRYRTSGRYATAVANGTAWTMTDRCDRTVIRVTQGTVTIRDLRRHRAVKVRAGRTYVALARPARR